MAVAFFAGWRYGNEIGDQVWLAHVRMRDDEVGSDPLNNDDGSPPHTRRCSQATNTAVLHYCTLASRTLKYCIGLDCRLLFLVLPNLSVLMESLQSIQNAHLIRLSKAY